MPKVIYTETRLYPVVIHQDDGVWGYVSPQFGGGGAASQADALAAAQTLLNEAVAIYVEAGDEPPAPDETVDADGGRVAWLPVTITNAAERVAITLPKALVARIDAATDNRSAFFAELARERLRS